MQIRNYEACDCEKLAKLFYNTVHSVNAKDYNEAQLEAWADGKADLDVWNQSFLEHDTMVAVEDGLLVGFGDINSSGYLDRLFVHKDYQGRGIGTEILSRLEEGCVSGRVTVHVSITAKPFFERRGYRMIREQQVIRKGISLKNYVMEKLLLKFD